MVKKFTEFWLKISDYRLIFIFYNHKSMFFINLKEDL